MFIKVLFKLAISASKTVSNDTQVEVYNTVYFNGILLSYKDSYFILLQYE